MGIFRIDSHDCFYSFKNNSPVVRCNVYADVGMVIIVCCYDNNTFQYWYFGQLFGAFIQKGESQAEDFLFESIAQPISIKEVRDCFATKCDDKVKDFLY